MCVSVCARVCARVLGIINIITIIVPLLTLFYIIYSSFFRISLCMQIVFSFPFPLFSFYLLMDSANVQLK